MQDRESLKLPAPAMTRPTIKLSMLGAPPQSALPASNKTIEKM
jgi:hypothetical protein